MKTYADFVDPAFSGQDYDTSKRPLNGKEINTYIAESFEVFPQYKYDELLWEAFKDEFDGWTHAHFAASNRILRKMTCEYLHFHGLYAADCRTNIDKLMKILTATDFSEIQFPTDVANDLAQKHPDTFLSKSNPVHPQKLEQKHKEIQSYLKQ
ncbi:hypothetical protein GGR53DRAFT_516963 [Hypoxylon sp. FL1150]|nr:hypothetical protein GGR53DRAFT_516963 [Hypoxylon sp. FL1150]